VVVVVVALLVVVVEHGDQSLYPASLSDPAGLIHLQSSSHPDHLVYTQGSSFCPVHRGSHKVMVPGLGQVELGHVCWSHQACEARENRRLMVSHWHCVASSE
ncbi:hypothetical protein, partial [Blastomonas fulva]|uniref:hypothetical protein n=1 Tax=Blastomonas fulva TaxID=1550728 RepID=UPI004033D3C6